MTLAQAIQHFGQKADIARALGITAQAVSDWGAEIPMLRQYELERLSGGKLKVDTKRRA